MIYTHRKVRLTFIGLLLTVLSVANTVSARYHIFNSKKIENISCKQALELIEEHKEDTNFVIIDFRPETMYSESHIEGALFHDVFSPDINEWLQSLDKRKTYLIYCNIGKRSGIALAKMEEMDFKNIYHMNQGLIQWKKLGYKTVSGYSEQNEFIPFDSDGITLSEHLIFNHFL